MIKYEKNANIILNVNNKNYELNISPSAFLQDVLRDNIGLTGTKNGCKNGDCGSCTVLINDTPYKSCMIFALDCIDKKITTIEGLSNSFAQQSFLSTLSYQCGFCTSGFIINLEGLLRKYKNPSEEIIEDWLSSNICRCTGYEGIKQAVHKAIELNLEVGEI